MVADAKAVNKFALSGVLDKAMFQFTVGDTTWYVGKHAAYAISTMCAYVKAQPAPERLTDMITSMISHNSLRVHPTGSTVELKKIPMKVYATDDGTEVWIAESMIRLFPGRLGLLAYVNPDKPSESGVLFKDSSGDPVGIIMPVRHR